MGDIHLKKTEVPFVVKSITFEPKSQEALNQFLEENKNKYHEIWIVITNKKTQNPQIVSFDQVIDEVKKTRVSWQSHMKYRCKEIHDTFNKKN